MPAESQAECKFIRGIKGDRYQSNWKRFDLRIMPWSMASNTEGREDQQDIKWQSSVPACLAYLCQRPVKLDYEVTVFKEALWSLAAFWYLRNSEFSSKKVVKRD